MTKKKKPVAPIPHEDVFDPLCQEVMGLTIRETTSVSTIVDNMIVLDEDKREVLTLSGDDKKELATLFYVKSNMSVFSKKSAEMESKVKEVGAPWMLAHGIKTVQVPGIGTFSLTEGKNVSISQDTLRKVLIKYVDADQVQEIINQAKKETPYVTLQFKK